jgi:hypothetical protein
VAEGEGRELDAFLTAIRLEMNSYINDVTTKTESPGDHPLTGFSVRH